MAAFDGLIKSLRDAERTLESQLSSVRSAISNLTEGGRHFMKDVAELGAAPPTPSRKRRRRRKLTAEGRAAIAAAQKKRWAKIKASQKSKKG